MKAKLLGVFLLLHSFYSLAEVPLARVVCTTSHASTSYALLELSDHYELQVKHHHGIDYMPIHEGIITIKDLETLSEWSKIFIQLGETYSIFLDKSMCKNERKSWVCHYNKPLEIGNLKVQNFSFYLSERRVIQKLTDTLTHHVSFAFLYNNSGYTLPMEYRENECLFRDFPTSL